MIDAPTLIAKAEFEFDQGNVELVHQFLLTPVLRVVQALALTAPHLLQDKSR